MGWGDEAGREAHLEQVMACYSVLDGFRVKDLSCAEGGLINQTYLVGHSFVLQRLHPIFGGGVNDDIRALAAILSARGVSVPALVPADDGNNSVEAEGIWRLLTYLPGRTLHRLSNEAQAESAGRLVGKFHGALLGVKHDFAFSRGRFHDTVACLAQLREAIDTHEGHRLAGPVHEIAGELHALWRQCGVATGLAARICHGDLKVSNLRFAVHTDEAESILDLDTMTLGTLDAELGDAFRSWCNRAVEHAPDPHWDLSFFQAAWTGFEAEASGWLTQAERGAVVGGILRITLELSARFAADALNESYFGFDPCVAPSRGEHNLARARNQLALAKIVQENQVVMEQFIGRGS